MISFSYTVVDPWAVVVELLSKIYSYALSAVVAMNCCVKLLHGTVRTDEVWLYSGVKLGD
jgi:hypothetical protein